MPLFHYTSIDQQGKKHGGIIDAPNLLEAKEKLRNQKLFIVSLEDNQKKSPFSFIKGKSDQLTGAHLVTFTNQLAQLLSANIPLYESLQSVEEQYRKDKFHRIIVSLCEQIKAGQSL